MPAVGSDLESSTCQEPGGCGALFLRKKLTQKGHGMFAQSPLWPVGQSRWESGPFRVEGLARLCNPSLVRAAPSFPEGYLANSQPDRNLPAHAKGAKENSQVLQTGPCLNFHGVSRPQTVLGAASASPQPPGLRLCPLLPVHCLEAEGSLPRRVRSCPGPGD